MKNPKIILIILTVALIFLNLGIFIGRTQFDGDISVMVEKKSDTAGMININTASVSTLCQLPGISTATGQKIVDHRERYGPYQSINDLLDIPGFSRSTLSAIKDYICVD